jgi:3-hydroxyisobutyrate dehydrogenase
MTIGYIGLGNMGGALARRLQRRHHLLVYDLNAAAMAAMTDAGTKSAVSLADMAAQCDIIFLCLPTSDHVRRAIFGEDGLDAGLHNGTLLIDQTTGDPASPARWPGRWRIAA